MYSKNGPILAITVIYRHCSMRTEFIPVWRAKLPDLVNFLDNARPVNPLIRPQ